MFQSNPLLGLATPCGGGPGISASLAQLLHIVSQLELSPWGPDAVPPRSHVLSSFRPHCHQAVSLRRDEPEPEEQRLRYVRDYDFKVVHDQVEDGQEEMVQSAAFVFDDEQETVKYLPLLRMNCTKRGKGMRCDLAFSGVLSILYHATCKYMHPALAVIKFLTDDSTCCCCCCCCAWYDKTSRWGVWQLHYHAADILCASAAEGWLPCDPLSKDLLAGRGVWKTTLGLDASPWANGSATEAELTAEEERASQLRGNVGGDE